MNQICTIRRCEEPAIVEAAETKGYTHRYCLNHLWQIEESDTVTLIGADSETTAPKTAAWTPPVTISQPIYNADGFSAGFRILHPPGVECSFHPVLKKCSCGKIDVGVVRNED